MCMRVTPSPEWSDKVYSLPPNCFLISRLIFLEDARSFLKRNWKKRLNSCVQLSPSFRSPSLHYLSVITTYTRNLLLQSKIILSLPYNPAENWFCFLCQKNLVTNLHSFTLPLVTTPRSFCWTKYALPTDNLISQFSLQLDVLQLRPIGCERKSECNNLWLTEGEWLCILLASNWLHLCSDSHLRSGETNWVLKVAIQKWEWISRRVNRSIKNLSMLLKALLLLAFCYWVQNYFLILFPQYYLTTLYSL